MKAAEFAPAVRSLAAEVGFYDPEHKGELARLFDGAGRKRRFLRRSGVTLDEFGELLWDRGILPERPTVVDVENLLATVFDGTAAARKAGKRPRKAETAAAIDTAAARAKRNRLRRAICENCGAIGYSSALVILEHCGRPMLRTDPTFSEVMQQTAGLDVVPF
jgi:hypothetical protein